MAEEIINTRILIIDDEELVRGNIEEILVPKKLHKNEALTNASDILFDEEEEDIFAASSASIPNFFIDKAINGFDGIEKVKRACNEQKPYAVIFVDMRMPGMDGLETILHIREVDTKAEIIIVTAYTDRSIDEIVAKAGQNVGYQCKPYATEEILQLAVKGVNDYNKLRNLETLISIVANLAISENHLNTLLQNILDQLAMYINTDMAVLGKLNLSGHYEKLFSIGTIEEKLNISQLINKISLQNIKDEDVAQVDDVVFAKLQDYCVFAVLNKNVQLKTEKLYLLRLFVQNSAKAIRNAKLYEMLLKKERLSAVGTAVGMLMHDLRGPIKNIPVITGLLREKGIDDPLVGLIEKCGEQSSEIVDDFMDFLNDSPLVKEPVNVGRLIKEGIALANNNRPIAPIELHALIDEDLYMAGDSSKLTRIFTNLISNATDAIKNAGFKVATIYVTAKKEHGKIKIVIQDTGPGIPPEIMDTLFEAFVTNKKVGGTGLGLAIVKQFILAHGGEITVHNDKGAVFTVYLPMNA